MPWSITCAQTWINRVKSAKQGCAGSQARAATRNIERSPKAQGKGDALVAYGA